MSENQQYAKLMKKAWITYYLLAIVIAAILVLFVASDYEEMFFYGLMTIAGSYVFRPTERFMDKQILKFTGVARPEESKAEESKETE